MSSSNRQQIYYQGRHHQQQSQQNRIGGLSLSSSHHQMGPASPHQDHHQVVVVSGSGQCTGCVADYHSSCGCPSCESKNLGTLGHETSLSDHEQQLYSYMDQGQLDDDDEGIVHEFTTDSGERHVVIMTKNDEQQQEGVISLQER
uniref:Nuclear receptor domain-containing protein n=1 Tax=Globodera pallida TaxID=36090 RepID=A0A183BTD2_GLOPA